MIILYAITGVITVLFLVVIISASFDPTFLQEIKPKLTFPRLSSSLSSSSGGAIRALRHPERYGPRSGRREASSYPYNFDDPRFGGGDANLGEGGEVAQTRTGGLARAIVDTFPIIKFAGSKKARNSVDARGGGLSGGGVVPSNKLTREAWEMPTMNENTNDVKRGSYQQHSSSSTYPHDPPSSRGSRDDVRSSYHSTKESLLPSTSPSRQGLADHHEEDEEEEDLIVPVLRSGHAAGGSSRLDSVDEKESGKDREPQEEEERREVGESCAICLLEVSLFWGTNQRRRKKTVALIDIFVRLSCVYSSRRATIFECFPAKVIIVSIRIVLTTGFSTSQETARSAEKVCFVSRVSNYPSFASLLFVSS